MHRKQHGFFRTHEISRKSRAYFPHDITPAHDSLRTIPANGLGPEFNGFCFRLPNTCRRRRRTPLDVEIFGSAVDGPDAGRWTDYHRPRFVHESEKSCSCRRVAEKIFAVAQTSGKLVLARVHFDHIWTGRIFTRRRNRLKVNGRIASFPNGKQSLLWASRKVHICVCVCV